MLTKSCTHRLYPPATERVRRASPTPGDDLNCCAPPTPEDDLNCCAPPTTPGDDLINTAAPGSRVKHPGTSPSSGSTLQAVDLQTIEGSRDEVRYTQSLRSGLQKKSAQSMLVLITQRTNFLKTATYLHDDSPTDLAGRHQGWEPHVE